MVTASTSAGLQRGDKVWVEWGFDEVPGTVLDVYGTGLGFRVVVSVDVQGPSGERLDSVSVTVPLASVHA